MRVENLEIRHYGAGDFGKGVYLRYCLGLRGARLPHPRGGAAGVWVKGGDRNRIEDNEIWDTSIFDWPWDLTKGSSAENNGVVFTDDVGRGNVVRAQHVHGTFNGIGPCGVGAAAGGASPPRPTSTTTSSPSTPTTPSSPRATARTCACGATAIRDVHMAFAVAPAAPGADLDRAQRRLPLRQHPHQPGGRLHGERAQDQQRLRRRPWGRCYLYHNTFLTDAPGTDAHRPAEPGQQHLHPRPQQRRRGHALRDLQGEPGRPGPGDGDDLYTTDATPVRALAGHALRQPGRLPGRHRPGAAGPLGRAAAREAAAAATSSPAPGSPLIDRGASPCPASTTASAARRPDIGAVEVGRGLLDVPTSNALYPWVEALVRRGVTAGCGVMPPRYCPDAAHGREMAVFLLRGQGGRGYQPPACVTPTFADVPCSNPFARWIEELSGAASPAAAAAATTAPTAPVTRGQMAVFLLATEGPGCRRRPARRRRSPTCPARTPSRLDRRGGPARHPGGCGACNYFPTTPVTRGAMAIFLTTTFGLP